MRLFLLPILMAAAFTSCTPFEQQPYTVGLGKQPLPESNTAYGYLAYIPEDYDSEKGKHPLVIFLHGKGELGDSTSQLDDVAAHGPFKLIKQDPSIFNQESAIVLAPQGLEIDDSWDDEKLDAFLEHALTRYRIDKKRIYLTGLSMGGGGTWKLANKYPDTFAAIIPICGAAKPDDSFIPHQLPTWSFHSIGDDVVSFDLSRQWLEGLRKNGLMDGYTEERTQSASFNGGQWVWKEGQRAPQCTARPTGLTVYPDTFHDSWTRAYDDPQLWNWLFAQRR